jgi:gluconolactonase
MSVEIRDRRFVEVVGPELAFERLATGLLFLEGPLWNAADRTLLFSDIPGDTIYRWHAGGELEKFRSPSHKSNGLTFDADGRLLVCEHATSRVTRTELDGSHTLIARAYQGRELNSPNDIVVRSDGGIYFSDPTFGRMEYYGVPRDPELAFRGVYRADAPAASPVLIADDFAQPNGLCFSLDERRLFVNDTERMHIRVFDVFGDGTVSGGAVWADVAGEGDGAPDGMKIDSEGHLYCCGPGGIHVFDAEACCLGVIRTPEPCANFTWGDHDLRSLYVTASTSLYRTRVRVPGRVQRPSPARVSALA